MEKKKNGAMQYLHLDPVRASVILVLMAPATCTNGFPWCHDTKEQVFIFLI